MKTIKINNKLLINNKKMNNMKTIKINNKLLINNKKMNINSR